MLVVLIIWFLLPLIFLGCLNFHACVSLRFKNDISFFAKKWEMLCFETVFIRPSTLSNLNSGKLRSLVLFIPGAEDPLSWKGAASISAT